MGEPGSGKTYIFKKILAHFVTKRTIYHGGFCYELFKNALGNDVFMLGKYDNFLFSGTDRLSMSCQPVIQQWILDMFSGIILIEGDRLCNKKFFSFCQSNTDFKVFFLGTEKCLCEERRKKRKSNQATGWIKGRITKILNLLDEYQAYPLNSNSDFTCQFTLNVLKQEINI